MWSKVERLKEKKKKKATYTTLSTTNKTSKFLIQIIWKLLSFWPNWYFACSYTYTLGLTASAEPEQQVPASVPPASRLCQQPRNSATVTAQQGKVSGPSYILTRIWLTVDNKVLQNLSSRTEINWKSCSKSITFSCNMVTGSPVLLCSTQWVRHIPEAPPHTVHGGTGLLFPVLHACPGSHACPLTCDSASCPLE